MQWWIYIVQFLTPPPGPNSFNFMQFLGKFGKIKCWRPPPESWRPLHGEILDPPLQWEGYLCFQRLKAKLFVFLDISEARDHILILESNLQTT